MPPETQTASQVFISYSRSDRAACAQLRTELEKAGLSVFRDEDNIQAGDEWITELEKALEQCTAFVLLIGQDGVQRWVSAEYHVALRRHYAKANLVQSLPIFRFCWKMRHRCHCPHFYRCSNRFAGMHPNRYRLN
ncbi:toll/interleukin-1 receptor domain-containing protein [Nitrosomonas sp.]|uniref:toll/interleukin-1 receptor domain-containing protein n=1 Tax=Nitrosomonas sp. TaxID=42353 RepID=UPI0035B058C3